MHDGAKNATVVPVLSDEADGVEPTRQGRLIAPSPSPKRSPYLVCLAGGDLGRPYPVPQQALTIGRSTSSDMTVDNAGVSRVHARIERTEDVIAIEDLGSANGTHVNGERLTERHVLRDGDRIQFGTMSVFRFAFLDALEEEYQHRVWSMSEAKAGSPPSRRRTGWAPDSWKSKPVAQAIDYEDPDALADYVKRLRRLPPLVTSWEIEDLKTKIAEAQVNERFLLQGGDCAETFNDCEPSIIASKLKILIQMSLVLTRGIRKPIIRVGRFGGQYAKPRSKQTETVNGVTLPSYFGDVVNSAEFNAEARKPDPRRLVDAYQHSALTLNFVRALTAGGFSDLRRPEYFDLEFRRADLPADLRMDFKRLVQEISDGMHFLRAVGDRAELMKLDFFASHEGLSLLYEAAQTRRVPRREGYYDLTTHLPWIGERTRALTGAHVEFFRGIENPVAVKLGPTSSPKDVVDLCQALNPDDTPGKLILITRMGVAHVENALPPIVEAVKRKALRVLWVSDPMHGNAVTMRSGIKTRNFEHILSEIELTMAAHKEVGTHLGGVHFELTGEDVTECIGGGLTEEDLSQRYQTVCDPRLNYRQAIQMAFCISRNLEGVRDFPTVPPPESPMFPND